MADAAYLRRQAELCFAMAGLLSNPVDAKHAHSAAEQYAQRARDAEKEQAATERAFVLPSVARGSYMADQVLSYRLWRDGNDWRWQLLRAREILASGAEGTSIAARIAAFEKCQRQQQLETKD